MSGARCRFCGCRMLRLWLPAAILLGTWGVGGCGPSPIPTAVPTTVPTPPLTPSPAILHPLVAIAPASLPLSGEWRFAVDPDGVGETQGWAAPGFDDSAWAAVTVPHTWNVMAGHSDYEGLAWYRCAFDLPTEAKDAQVRLRFEAVFYQARVWLNGTYLGLHEGGYTPFEFDVTGLAVPGESNVVAVLVDNLRAGDRIPAVLSADWSFDWWNYGGIVRDVWLEVTSRLYIARQRIVARPHLVEVDAADRAAVSTTVTLQNHSTDRFEGTVRADVVEDGSGRPVLAAPSVARVNLGPGETAQVLLTAEIAGPALWHFDHPRLYRWLTQVISASGEVIHSAEDTFGVRRVELKEGQFYLNGEPVRLVGVTRHADSPQHGLAETTTVMAADYDDLKRLNTVLSRPVHYPQSEFILDYCDRNGILLIPEVPAWQLSAAQMANPQMRELEQQQLREMVEAGFNHPSVWAWSVGNEIESESPAGHAFVRDMVAYVKSLDPTRPVGFASNRLNRRPKDDATDAADLVLMNQYFGTWVGPKEGLGPALDWIHQTWPDRVVIITEFGFEPHWNALWGPPSDSLDPSQYYLIPDGVPSSSERADEQRRQLIREQMAVFRSKPFVAGAVFWCYQDYRTRSGFIMGLLDPQRSRRASWWLLREEYAPVLFEGVEFSPVAAGRRGATVTLRTRGPVDQDMPAYTLRGYRLHWAVRSPGGDMLFSEGDLDLPTLAPGTAWSGQVEWAAPSTDYLLTVSVVRPTGFSVIERSYGAQGQLLPSGLGVP